MGFGHPGSLCTARAKDPDNEEPIILGGSAYGPLDSETLMDRYARLSVAWVQLPEL